MYTYKMVQLAPSILVKGKNANTAAADYLQGFANQYAEEGWEFQRIDAFSTEEPAGCLASLFGKKNMVTTHYVATFRKQVNNT